MHRAQDACREVLVSFTEWRYALEELKKSAEQIGLDEVDHVKTVLRSCNYFIVAGKFEYDADINIRTIPLIKVIQRSTYGCKFVLSSLPGLVEDFAYSLRQLSLETIEGVEEVTKRYRSIALTMIRMKGYGEAGLKEVGRAASVVREIKVSSQRRLTVNHSITINFRGGTSEVDGSVLSSHSALHQAQE
ncbi:hypothetical protein H2200_005710 [Cladophialophora chaetospira]|uniref:Uncharacterized protein n=1 Tax=Cladophialophora chaetospira TaxID=386627 RepID=A0AA38X9N5_9EURO|nr:hypothetical protein H2200_005710 [Cladophialophora chaetospira]